MEQKTAIYKGLEFNDAYYEDSSLTSPDYFQITEFPIFCRDTDLKNLMPYLALLYVFLYIFYSYNSF